MGQTGGSPIAMERSLGGPGWRAQLAREQARKPESRPRIADDLVRQAGAYLYLSAGGPAERQQAARRYPHIADAIRLWQHDESVERIKVLVIADCPRDEIARRFALREETVAVAEQLFFDIRPCLDARDWIACRVLIAAVKAGDDRLAARLKLAYHGGPEIARRLLEADVRLPLEDAERQLDRELLLHQKLQVALDAPFETPKERHAFLELAMKYQRQRAALQLKQQKLAHQREQDRRAYELERLRLQTAAGVQVVAPADSAAAGAGPVGGETISPTPAPSAEPSPDQPLTADTTACSTECGTEPPLREVIEAAESRGSRPRPQRESGPRELVPACDSPLAA